MIRFIVEGKAAPAGSKTAFAIRNGAGELVMRGNGSPLITVTDSNKKAAGWKQEVKRAARQAYRGPILTHALKVTLVFHVLRPKGHFGSGKNAGTIKASSPKYPTMKPDVLKLSRGIEDALTKIIWLDDSQIVEEHLHKVYDTQQFVEVIVEDMYRDDMWHWSI